MQFDDLTVVLDESRLNPIGIYKNISFTNFDAAQPGAANETLSGIMPESKPNQALLSASPANMTIAYAGSKIKSLALTSFYYGCAGEVPEGVADVAVACNVTAMGYKAGFSTPVIVETFIFTPAEPLDTMNPATLGIFSNKFQTLQIVEFVVEPSSGVTCLLDNIVGTLQA